MRARKCTLTGTGLVALSARSSLRVGMGNISDFAATSMGAPSAPEAVGLSTSAECCISWCSACGWSFVCSCFCSGCCCTGCVACCGDGCILVLPAFDSPLTEAPDCWAETDLDGTCPGRACHQEASSCNVLWAVSQCSAASFTKGFLNGCLSLALFQLDTILQQCGR